MRNATTSQSSLAADLDGAEAFGDRLGRISAQWQGGGPVYVCDVDAASKTDVSDALCELSATWTWTGALIETHVDALSRLTHRSAAAICATDTAPARTAGLAPVSRRLYDGGQRVARARLVRRARAA